ncbi:hypothetical protein [Oceanirhabdus sp. W0125-5]|uniref:hypothetical protein n=1 Tax=Oceanirhabdus sp. W0125-5 TaxID=2999116 RepID=UPI0022F325B3|nr:hypothetical protein [Oceanirhabdus sp. W0125-5]WBW98141.1 hypothetical protein OW730_05075 [Oceanirhabdus sp. W0125-5]
MLNKNINKFFATILCLLFVATNTVFAIEGYSEVIEETSNIISFPENTVKGKIDFSIEGNTGVNILGKGYADYDKMYDFDAFYMGDGYAKITMDGTYKNTFFKFSDHPVKSNTQYTVFAEVRKNTSNGLFVLVDSHSSSAFTSEAIIDAGETGIFKFLRTTKSDLTGITVTMRSWNNLSSTLGEIELRVMLLEGDWTNKEISYFEGVQGAKVHNVKILTKNLIPSVQIGNIGSDGTMLSDYNHSIYTGLTEIKPNTEYISSFNNEIYKTSALYITTYDADLNIIRPRTALTGTKKFTSLNNEKYVRLYAYNVKNNLVALTQAELDNLNVMLVEGSTAPIEYIQYQEHTENIGVELHGINGIHDTFEGNTVKRRIKEHTITAEDFATMYTGFTHYDLAQTNVNLLNGFKEPTDNNVLENTTLIQGYNRGVLNDRGISGKTNYYYVTIEGRIDFLFPKGTTIDQAKTLLVGTKILYVAKEQYHETQQLILPSIIAEPNGTMIIDNSTKFAAMYTDGLTIENKDLPIEHVEKVYKIKDGIKTAIDLNNVKVEGGQVITIAGAINGEIYEVSYKFPSQLTTTPTIKYSVPINMQGQINGNLEIVENNNKLMQEIKNRLQILRQQMGL